MKKTLIATIGIALFVAGCASGKQYVTDAQNMYKQQDGQVGDLLAKNASLTERAGKLPSDLPGVTEVTGDLGKNKTELETLKGDLAAYPTKIEAAVKDKKLADAKSLLAEQKTASGPRLTAAGDELKKLEATIADLEAKAASAAKKPAMYQKSLSTGFALTGNLEGVEAQLIAFIEDPNKPADKTTWFNFDRLNFAFGAAELDMDHSKPQLVNIVEIMKAFPAVKLKIGGYTDNVGKAAFNQKLSDSRASNVMKALVALGVDAKRLASEGYGDKFPECAANDTDECRAKNRRIALRVSAK